MYLCIYIFILYFINNIIIINCFAVVSVCIYLYIYLHMMIIIIVINYV